MPSVEPTERSTLRVTMTMVSPIASKTNNDALVRICWILVRFANPEVLMPTVFQRSSHFSSI